MTKIVAKLPKSHIFYDIQTIMPGQSSTEAIKSGLLKANVFVIFVSPNTPNSIWVNYEACLAEVEQIRRPLLKVLVCPIKSATYNDAPEWMQAYNAFPSGYFISDIARSIKYQFDQSLVQQGLVPSIPFVGREALINKILSSATLQSMRHGIATNLIILAGIENMGRTSVARAVIPHLFPGARSEDPYSNYQSGRTRLIYF